MATAPYPFALLGDFIEDGRRQEVWSGLVIALGMIPYMQSTTLAHQMFDVIRRTLVEEWSASIRDGGSWFLITRGFDNVSVKVEV